MCLIHLKERFDNDVDFIILIPEKKEESQMDTFNFVVHGLNSLGMFIDTLVVAYPLKLCHVVQPILFAVSYVLFTYIFYLCDGKDP